MTYGLRNKIKKRVNKLSNPTIEVVALIDEDIIARRIVKEWFEEINEVLQDLADKLERKYFYKVKFYDHGGIWDIIPTMELQRLINEGGADNRE